jgi:hypothetical protein
MAVRARKFQSHITSCGKIRPILEPWFYIYKCATLWTVALKRPIFKRKNVFANLSYGLFYDSKALSQPRSRDTVPLIPVPFSAATFQKITINSNFKEDPQWQDWRIPVPVRHKSSTWYVSTGKASGLLLSVPGLRDLVRGNSPQLPVSRTFLHFSCSVREYWPIGTVSGKNVSNKNRLDPDEIKWRKMKRKKAKL